MSRIESKSARLSQIEALLIDHPEGMTQSQIAQRLGVHRSTILRNLADLQAPVYEDHCRYFIDRESYLVNLRLTMHEVLSIHLAARLMATRMDRQNPHAASALRKLGISLGTLAPRISHFIKASADEFDNDTKRQDPRYLQVLEKMTVAWAEQRRVHLWYQGAGAERIKEYEFCPYYIEVNAIGQSMYAIGRIEPSGELRTFKLERAERIELETLQYDIPPDFDPVKLMGTAWGIWYTDQEPIEVKLKFSQRVAPRVRETRWHPTEQVSVNDDGSLLWCALIAEPREMMPWVRGWGADVEVMEPIELKDEMIKQSLDLFKIYHRGEND
jgi:predicted DNA-binding transcriptional regulator YafY